MRVNKADLLDIAIWVLIAFYTLVAHWIWVARGIQETVIIALLAIAIISRASFKIKTSQIAMLASIIVLTAEVIFSTFNASSTDYFVQDLKAMLGCFLSFIYLFQFRRLKYDTFQKFSGIVLKFLNYYTVFNHLLIMVQSKIPYFLMNRSAIESVNNSLYFDQLTGFLGVNGTTRWSMVTILVIVLNFSVAIEKKSKRFLYYNIALIATSVYIATVNSARAFFILMPLTLVLFFIYAASLNWTRKIKIIFGAFIVLSLFFVAYMYNSSVNSYVNTLIEDKFNVYISWNVDDMIAANDDRAIAVDFAVRNGGAFGMGIGYIPMHSSNEEVTYLGLNSASSFIYMIGIVGYFLYAVTLTLIVVSRKSNRWSKLIVFTAYIVVTSYLLPVFSSIALMFSFAYILSLLDYQNKNDSRIIKFRVF